MLPRVAKELEELREDYPSLQYQRQPDGSIHVEISNLPLPPGWSQNATTVLFILPVGYPQAPPTVFYADPNIRAPGGRNPNYSSQEQVGNKTWTKFCWRPQPWNMSTENLWKYVKFVQRAFAESL